MVTDAIILYGYVLVISVYVEPVTGLPVHALGNQYHVIEKSTWQMASEFL
jgi:hypothetical protein